MTRSIIFLCISRFREKNKKPGDDFVLKPNIFSSAPEMTFSAFSVALRASQRQSLLEFRKTRNLQGFCSEQERLFFAFRSLESSFGPTLLVSVLFLTVVLVSSLYFAFVTVVEMMSQVQTSNRSTAEESPTFGRNAVLIVFHEQFPRLTT